MSCTCKEAKALFMFAQWDIKSMNICPGALIKELNLGNVIISGMVYSKINKNPKAKFSSSF